MNKIKRGLALLLTMILLCTALPISAQAKTTGNKTVNKANIVLFGYFADDTQTAADAYFDQYAGELVGYIDGSFGRSLKNYLSSISYGQLQMKNTIPQYDGTTVHALQVPVKESDALVQNMDTQIIESLIRQMPSIADKAVDLVKDVLLNALKRLGGIQKDMHLISPIVIEPIQDLKVNHLGNHNPRLHMDEVLIALSISAATNPTAEVAMRQLDKLRGCEAHSTVILSGVDSSTFRKLGINVTCEPKYQTKKLYHK